MTTNNINQVLETIGNRLYTIRHQKREKLTSVATAIGISHPVISLVENGRYKGLTLDLLLRICNHYSISMEELLNAESTHHISETPSENILQHLKTENEFLRTVLLKQEGMGRQA